MSTDGREPQSPEGLASRVPEIPKEVGLTVPTTVLISGLTEGVLGMDAGNARYTATLSVGDDEVKDRKVTALVPVGSGGKKVLNALIQEAESIERTELIESRRKFLDSITRRRRTNLISTAVGSATVTSSLFLLTMNEEAYEKTGKVGISVVMIGGLGWLARSIFKLGNKEDDTDLALQRLEEAAGRYDVLRAVIKYANK